MLALVFMISLIVRWNLAESTASQYAFYPVNENSKVVIADRRSYDLKEKEKLLFRFIEKYFIGPGGEIPSLVQTPGGDANTLSESIGLLMEYCILTDKKELFNKEYTFLKSNLLTEEGYVRWQSGGQETGCNAAIDDLRIIGALLDAGDQWERMDYIETAVRIQDKIYQAQGASGILSEFYDWSQGKAKDGVPLCYLDVHTMNRLSTFNEKWKRISANSLKILRNGRLEGKSPFFYKYYDISKGAFLKDEEYGKDKEICMIYTLYSALHMARINEDTDFFTQWLKAEMEGNRLYGWYNPDTLKPSRKMESTAVYALGALYAERKGEDELYYTLIGRMLDFMVSDSESNYYGGFGNKYTGRFYSFDNLLALLALASVPMD